jgi:hypothetical protein
MQFQNPGTMFNSNLQQQPPPPQHIRPQQHHQMNQPQNSNLVLRKPPVAMNLPPRPIMPARPFVPPNRSRVDKILDFLVGDGPSNRYALICRRCSSHNGMALKEEFEFISFNCCYCSFFNQGILSIILLKLTVI